MGTTNSLPSSGFYGASSNLMVAPPNACNLALSADVTGLVSFYMDVSKFSLPPEASGNFIRTFQDGCNLPLTTRTARNVTVSS